MASPLPKELLALQAGFGHGSLPPVAHVRTPTGTWGAKDSAPEGLEDERNPIITYGNIDGVSILKLNEKICGVAAAELAGSLMTLIPRGRDAGTAEHFTRITGGLLITVERSLREPLVITHRYAPGTAAFRNTLIRVAPGAEAIIIELHEGGPAAASHVAEAFLAEGSRLVHATVHEAGTRFSCRRSAAAGRDASMDWFELAATDAESFSRAETLLEGEGASTRNLIVFLSRHGLIDIGASAEHHAPRTASSLAARGVLAGDAKGFYEGTLAIGREAAKSRAFQQEHVLIIGDEAESRASPTLLIENNDVECTHAATTGRLDAERLFYLMARGLAQDEAERLLIKAFVWPAIEALGTAASCKILPYAEPVIDRFSAGPGAGADVPAGGG